VLSALRITPLFIGPSLLFLLDLDDMATGVAHQNGPVEPKLG
jgi:hypothetical protein